MSGVILGSRKVFFSFCIDFFVDSVPRNSLTTVEPRYYIIYKQKELFFLRTDTTDDLGKVFKHYGSQNMSTFYKNSVITILILTISILSTILNVSGFSLGLKYSEELMDNFLHETYYRILRINCNHDRP